MDITKQLNTNGSDFDRVSPERREEKQVDEEQGKGKTCERKWTYDFMLSMPGSSLTFSF